MKVAYVTSYDSTDVHQWAGLGTNIVNCLEGQGIELVRVGSFPEYSDAWLLLKRIYYNKLVRRGVFRTDRDTAVLKQLGRAVASRLRDLDIDAVFSPGTLPISYLNIARPILFWTDATFAGLLNSYADLSDLCPETIRSGTAAEQAALSRCQAAIYSSQWAADTARTHYQVDPTKLHVVPFGANVEARRTETDIVKILDEKKLPCRLLFIGMDWQRKGGDVAVTLAENLHQRGIATELIVLGCVPPVVLPDFVKVVGYVSKATAEGREAISGFLRSAHFLVLPSRADCAPVVVAEANSFGMPALTTNLAGFSTLIRQGKNGHTFSPSDYVEKSTAIVTGLMENPSAYREMGIASFAEYQNRLNWDVAGKKIAGILSSVLEQSAALRL